MNLKIPFDKSDVHYDASKGEVSLKREKFDELMRFVRDLLEETRETENERDTARARQKRSAALADQYAELLQDASRSVERWLKSNSIQELSRRTEIPYATCHRIVSERLNSAEVTVGNLGKILKAMGSSPAERRPVIGLFVGNPAASWKATLERMKSSGMEIMMANTGLDAAEKAEEYSPDQVIVDLSAPNLNLTGDMFTRLCGNSRLTVLTGADQKKARELLGELTADL
jgi:hypothetical protein